MSVLLTTAGGAHLGQLNGGTLPTTRSFDAIVFGDGNVVPAVGDTVGTLGNLLDPAIRLQPDYPVLGGDGDGRNTGSGASVWTWKFVREKGEPFVASNVAVTDYSGGIFDSANALMVHGKQVMAQKYDERLIVWVNVDENAVVGAAEGVTIISASEASFDDRLQRVVGFTARNRALAGHPGGTVVSHSKVTTQPHPGGRVWTAVHTPGPYGRQLRPEDVKRFTVSLSRLKASEGTFVPVQLGSVIGCAGHVTGSLTLHDQRFPYSEGYNVSHTYKLPLGTDEGTWKLVYEMKLCDGDTRRWTNVAEIV